MVTIFERGSEVTVQEEKGVGGGGKRLQVKSTRDI